MPRNIVLVGLYRSGSSFWAEMLHHLGVNMGAPYWETDEENHPNNHYEPADLSVDLRRMWNEPQGTSHWGSDERQGVMRRWLGQQRRKAGPDAVLGAKHPLFCLMMADVYAAFDMPVVLRCSRPLPDSMRSIARTTFPWSKVEMYEIQLKLWGAAEQWFAYSPPHITLNANEWKKHCTPNGQGWRARLVEDLCMQCNLHPTQEQFEKAMNCFRTGPTGFGGAIL